MPPLSESTRTELSVVIPVFNAAAFVAERVGHLTSYLDQSAISYEMVLVNDGSTDGTAKVLESLASERHVALHLSRNLGKFAAIAAGMETTRGRCCLFTDADVPYDLHMIPYMMRLVREQGFHIAVGDRTLPGSSYSERLLSFQLPQLRRAGSRFITAAVRLLVTAGLYDTQCGIKTLRGDVARTLFPLLREPGFAGDVELLYVALKYNLAIRRVPARVVYQGPSSVKPMQHGFAMLRALATLRRRWDRGFYRSETLAALAAQSYWEEV